MTATKQQETVSEPDVEIHEALALAGLADWPTREELEAVRHADALFGQDPSRDRRIHTYVHLFAYGQTVVDEQNITLRDLVFAYRRTKPLGLVPRLLHQRQAAIDAGWWGGAILLWLVIVRWLAGIGGLIPSSMAIAIAVYGPLFIALSWYDVMVDWAGGDSSVVIRRR